MILGEKKSEKITFLKNWIYYLIQAFSLDIWKNWVYIIITDCLNRVINAMTIQALTEELYVLCKTFLCR